MNDKQNIKLILASGSPRRKQLLEISGFSPIIMVSNIEEIPKETETATEYVMRNAREKGIAIANKFSNNEIILSADTIVVTNDGTLLEKPLDENHAKTMLKNLSNSTHKVYTAYVLTQNKKELISKIIETKVTFKNLNDDEIENYIATKEPYDKAGAYGIQGPAAYFVEKIDGSYTNVMGLPLSQVVDDLKIFLKGNGC
jgi:septum formation protein